MFDQLKNFAWSTVATAPSPAASGTSLVVQSGHGARFGTPPFNVTIWQSGKTPITSDSVEIATCTTKVGDTLTIVRAQEDTSARTILVGDQIEQGVTKDLLCNLPLLEDGSTTHTISVSAGGSIQDAVDEALIYASAGQTVQINLAAGTYTAGCVVNGVACGRANSINGVSPGTIIINGAGIASTTLADTSAQPAAIVAIGFVIIILRNFKISSTNGCCLFPSYGAIIASDAEMDFGNTGGGWGQLHAESFGTIYFTGTAGYTISNTSSVGAHIECSLGGRVIYSEATKTVTLSGTPSFSVAFVYCQDASIVYIPSNFITFTGSATATRYGLRSNSVLLTNGGSATFLPGSALGWTKGGAIYTPEPEPTVGNPSAGLGTGATVALTTGSNDHIGAIEITIGTSPGSSGTLDLTFASGMTVLNGLSAVFTLSPGNNFWDGQATAQSGGINVAGNKITISVDNNGTSFSGGGTYFVFYQIEPF